MAEEGKGQTAFIADRSAAQSRCNLAVSQPVMQDIWQPETAAGSERQRIWRESSVSRLRGRSPRKWRFPPDFRSCDAGLRGQRKGLQTVSGFPVTWRGACVPVLKPAAVLSVSVSLSRHPRTRSDRFIFLPNQFWRSHRSEKVGPRMRCDWRRGN